MRYIFLLTLFFVSLSASAQIYRPPQTYGIRENRIKADSTLHLPLDTSNKTRSNILDPGAIVYNLSDSAIYAWDGKRWIKQGRTGSGSGINVALDSAYRSNDTIYFPTTTGGLISVKMAGIPQGNIVGLVTSLDSTLKRPFLNTDKRLNYVIDGPVQTSFSINAREGHVMKIGKDTLLNIAVNSVSPLHAAPDGGISRRYSFDGGVTWTGWDSVIYDVPYFSRNPAVGLMDNGRIGLFYKNYQVNASNNGGGIPINMKFMYSDDKGATWSTPIVVNPANGYARMEPFGRPVKFGDGNWYMAAYKDTSGNFSNYIEIYQSTNNGSTWTVKSIIDSTSNVAGKVRWEPAMEYIGNNRVIMTMRNNASGSDSLTTPLRWVSSDNGNTWTYQGATNLTADVPRGWARAPVCHLFDSTNNVLITVSSSRSLSNSSFNDSLYVYVDNVDSIFSNPRAHNRIASILRPLPNQLYLYGYPDIVKVNDSSYLCMFSEKFSDKVFTRNNLAYEHDNLFSFFITRRNDISSVDKLFQTRYSNMTFVKNRKTRLFDAIRIPASIQDFGDSTKRIAADGGLVIETTGGRAQDTLMRVKSALYYNDVLKVATDDVQIEGNLTVKQRAGTSTLARFTARTGTFSTGGLDALNVVRTQATQASAGGAIILSALNSNSDVTNYARMQSVVISNTAGTENGAFEILTRTAGALTEKVRVLDNGNVGIYNTSPTSRLDVTGAQGYNQLRLRTSYTPTGTADTNGNTGDIAWDSNYFYIKTSAGWKRLALTTF